MKDSGLADVLKKQDPHTMLDPNVLRRVSAVHLDKSGGNRGRRDLRNPTLPSPTGGKGKGKSYDVDHLALFMDRSQHLGGDIDYNQYVTDVSNQKNYISPGGDRGSSKGKGKNKGKGQKGSAQDGKGWRPPGHYPHVGQPGGQGGAAGDQGCDGPPI